MQDADYIQTTRRAVKCPYCGQDKPAKWGRNSNGNQRYRCKPCGKTFLHTGALAGHRASADIVGAAIRTYFGGNSYKQTAETLAQNYEIPEPSKATVYEWVTDYTDHAKAVLEDHPAHTSGKWVADETQVKVGGESYWVWNVLDAGTRYLLAVHLSPNRDTRAAVAVMRKAMAAADEPPKSITTDKLGSYDGAIRQVFPDAEHIKSEGIRAELNNNMSERLQGTIKDRNKTLRGLEALESGQQHLDGFTVNYNLFREHEGIGLQTPAEMAGVNPPFDDWDSVVRHSAVHGRRQPSEPISTMATAADQSPRRGPETAGPNVHFVPDPTLRRRPKGETESDDPDDYPLSPPNPLRPRTPRVKTGWRLPR